ncbi:MAG: DNA-3-methyladenine glycosylase I [Methanomassiliicoccaceae archaeon]|jgi:DNA-3-methyladenine glycosylase I|nr:DNA-3-methyladenine glycosylase I [Methanomassiliicoccaceae archaeon]
MHELYGKDGKFRCFGNGDELYEEYHDNEWGRPVHDDIKLFEMLTLEAMQAGLSWITVLRKRETFRIAFDNFDPEKVSKYDQRKVEELMQDPGIIRNRLKIESTIDNAKAILEVQKKYGSFDKLIWSYVDNKPIVGKWERFEDMPLLIPLATKISKDLKKMGFRFVGPMTVQSFIQAVGIVNDHLKECPVHEEMEKR